MFSFHYFSPSLHSFFSSSTPPSSLLSLHFPRLCPVCTLSTLPPSVCLSLSSITHQMLERWINLIHAITPMTEEKEKKRKSALSLVTRKSTKKVLGKWRKLESVDKDDQSEQQQPQQLPKLFGLSLDDVCRIDPCFDGIPVPCIMRQCIDYVQLNGLEMEGIYRVSSPKSRLDELERVANTRGDPALFDPSTVPDFRDAHEAAGLLKRFLRQLPHPLLPPSVDELVERCECDWRNPCKCGISSSVSSILNSLTPSRRLPLAYIFIHAQIVVSHESSNKMGVPALGLLLQTILDMSRRAVCLLMANATPMLSGNVEGATFLFTDVEIKPYIPPKTASIVDDWLCEDKPSIEEEIEKQNALLKYLHDKVSSMSEGPAKTAAEERLWGVQQVVTSLRRRLRTVVEPTKEDTTASDKARPRIFEEKQLLAVQSMLREDILEEERRIGELCWKLVERGVDMKEFLLSPPPSSSPDPSDLEWKEQVILEEAARGALIGEISKLRTDCAVLRANLELCHQEGVQVVTRF